MLLRSVLSHLTGGSLREKELDDRREWRNVLSHLTAREAKFGDRREWRNVLSHWTAREGTWRSSGVAECFFTPDCVRRHLAIVGSG